MSRTPENEPAETPHVFDQTNGMVDLGDAESPEPATDSEYVRRARESSSNALAMIWGSGR